MANEHESAIEKDQKIAPQTTSKDDVTDKELEKASGGITWTWTDGGAPKA